MASPSETITLNSPAKVNLCLSVHGKRDDGFHALSSVVAALEFGDVLSVRCAAGDALECEDPEVPLGPENLILKAAAAFRARLGREEGFHFRLEKRIPMGAGLGGGSSNAALALRGMNSLLGDPLTKDELRELAAAIGSDCPFFIDAVPAVMRGRGEILEPLDAATGARLRGMPVILFRPDFAVGTAWAYGQLVAGAPESYESEAHGLARIERFIEGGPEAALLNNSFEAAVGQKYLAIPTLLDALRTEGYAVLMSGSGSCCFALGECNRKKLKQILNAAWGEGVFWVETTIR